MHVVILGGGFGGIKAALELSKRQIGKVTLISDQPFFQHHSTLYATATGKSTEESIIPLHTFFQHHPSVEVIEDTIQSFDPRRKLVSSKKRDYHYDKLILSLGSVTTFLGIKGLSKHSYGINSIKDVQAFQDHIHDEVVRQKLDKEYFIIGAGMTGVELAGALQEYINSLKSLYRLKNTRSKVTLVEEQPRILPRMSNTASKVVGRQLKRRGISVLVNHKVTALANDTVTINGRLHKTSTAIWTSGLANNPFYTENREYFDLTKDNHVIVNPYLEALEHVYVIGDNNSVKHGGRAWAAFDQAEHVAKNITRLVTKRSQIPFHPRTAPVAVSVGEEWSYIEWHGVYQSGQPGTVLRRWLEYASYRKLLPSVVAQAIWRAHDIDRVRGE